MTNMKDKITDTWTFKLNTVFQIGFSSLVEESFSSVSRNTLNKQNSSEEKPDLYVDQDQQYFWIKRKTKCKADRTAQRVILMPNLVSTSKGKTLGTRLFNGHY